MEEKIKRVYIPMTETGFYILFCLQIEMHGYNIIQRVSQMTNGEIQIGAGTMYGSLKGWTHSFYKRRRKKKVLSNNTIGTRDIKH